MTPADTSPLQAWWSIWPSFLKETMDRYYPGLAPQNLNQPINPGWNFGTSITINEVNSSDPQIEKEIVAAESYGRQLGRVLDALNVLIGERPKGGQTPEALQDFAKMYDRIEGIKEAERGKQQDRLAQALKRLQEDDPQAFREVLAAVGRS